MKIALYHPWLKGKGGAEKLLLEVLERSSHDVTLFTLFYDREATFSGFENHDVRVIGSDKAPRGFFDKALRFGFGSLLSKIDLSEFDVFVVSEAGLGSLITLRNHNIPTVCYCHTPLRAALPEFQRTYRREVSRWLRPVYDTGILLYNLLEGRAWKRFRHVMANSALTKRRIVEKGLSAEQDVRVVNPGVDVEQFQPDEFDQYFLYPSRFRRYKRQDLAIEAFKEAGLGDFKLILAGDGQEEEYVEELREMAEGHDNIEIRTDVPDDEWTALYENAYSVLFLAENEDWGIVPLEGMAAGKPVIAVNEGGFTDVLEDEEHGFLVDADVENIAEAMRALAQDEELAQTMGEQGRERVTEYSWDAFIDQFDEYVEAEA